MSRVTQQNIFHTALNYLLEILCTHDHKCWEYKYVSSARFRCECTDQYFMRDCTVHDTSAASRNFDTHCNRHPFEWSLSSVSVCTPTRKDRKSQFVLRQERIASLSLNSDRRGQHAREIHNSLFNKLHLIISSIINYRLNPSNHAPLTEKSYHLRNMSRIQ